MSEPKTIKINEVEYVQKSEELYVLVCERDVWPDRDDGRPIVFEQYIDNGRESNGLRR